MEGDVATRKQLTAHVKRVARSLGFDQIEHSPQNAVRRIWRQMQSLKPFDEKCRALDGWSRELRRILKGGGEGSKVIPLYG